MSQEHPTAPEDRIPFHQKVIYGLGGFVNNTLAAAIGGMVIVLNLGLGMNPALVGLLGAIPRLTDAITDPLMGYISDNTRSRWGRRRPYIFVGAIAAGIIFFLLWQLPEGRSDEFYFWTFLGGSMVFFLAYTVFATPWGALGYELTPDYHERTRVMGVQNFISQTAYLISPWFLWFMQLAYFGDLMEGASALAGIVAVFVIGVGIMPAIFLRERYQGIAMHEIEVHETQQDADSSSIVSNVREFFNGFLITIRFKPFLMLCAATFLVFNGFMLISSFQFYVIIYYVFGGDTGLGAEYAGYSGTIGALATFGVIALVTWLATVIGKRRAFFFTTGIAVAGYLLKWFCYDPETPWLLLLPAPLMAFGLGGLFTLMGSMMADVCDLDELETGERREGMYGSIFWWVVKLGMAAALAGGGFLLNATGFDVELAGNQSGDTIFLMRLFDVLVPAISSVIAICVVALFPITEERATEIRAELEARRGRVQ
jgi:GPH family glycoside/pentoside/hexuronide:cation symporter